MGAKKDFVEFQKRIANNQLIFENDANEVVAFLEFEVDGNVFVGTHTNVDSSLRGHGIAAQLMEDFCQYAEQEQKKIQPVCTYAVSWLEKNPKKYIV